MILKKFLGEIMANMGFVTKAELKEALIRQREIIDEKTLPEQLHRPSLVSEARQTEDATPLLGQILTDMGFVTGDQLDKALEEQNKLIQVYGSLNSEKLGVALEMGSIVNSTLNLANVLTIIMGHANQVTNSAASTLMLLDDKTGELVFSVPTGPEADKLMDIRLPPGKGIPGWVVENEQPVFVDNAIEDPRFYPKIDKIRGIETKSILCVPLKAKMKLIGVLEVINKIDNTSFNEEDALFLSIFASQAAIAIENARLYSELKDRLEEHQLADQALRESEERYRSLVENVPDIIFTLDKNRNFTSINEFGVKLFGYRRDELIGKNLIEIIHPDDVEITWPLFNDDLFNKIEIPRDLMFRIIAKDRSIIWVSLNANMMFDKEGSFLEGQGVARDITQQKILQTQLLRAQRMEALGTLAGGVAHDLNNILTGLVSYPELLLMEIPPESPLRKPILTIKKSGEKAAAIVQDLLTLARRGVADMDVVNLNDIISEYLKSPEYEMLKSYHPSIQVTTNFATELLNIIGSNIHLSKTIMNLVSNAAEATPMGGKIFISSENQYIDKPVKGYDSVEEGDYVTLTVSDNGVGISSEDMERIFEPFYTKKEMGRSGTGLGMALIWGTVKDHKGYIDVKSTMGRGTTITLYFPVTRKEMLKEKYPLSIENYMGNGESILVVDDVEEQRVIASLMLKKLGYSVTSVSSGEEAVEYMKNNSADLLLLDMIMDPYIDGLETYKRILKLHAGQKAIIASGFSETKRVKEAQRLGAGVYIKKPYILEKIGLSIKQELGPA